MYPLPKRLQKLENTSSRTTSSGAPIGGTTTGGAAAAPATGWYRPLVASRPVFGVSWTAILVSCALLGVLVFWFFWTAADVVDIPTDGRVTDPTLPQTGVSQEVSPSDPSL